MEENSLRPFERCFLLGISQTKEYRMRKSQGIVKEKILWSSDDKDFVAKNLHLTDREIALVIGKSALAVKRFRNRNRIIKDEKRRCN